MTAGGRRPTTVRSRFPFQTVPVPLVFPNGFPRRNFKNSKIQKWRKWWTWTTIRNQVLRLRRLPPGPQKDPQPPPTTADHPLLKRRRSKTTRTRHGTYHLFKTSRVLTPFILTFYCFVCFQDWEIPSQNVLGHRWKWRDRLEAGKIFRLRKRPEHYYRRKFRMIRYCFIKSLLLYYTIIIEITDCYIISLGSSRCR